MESDTSGPTHAPLAVSVRVLPPTATTLKTSEMAESAVVGLYLTCK